jgi:hypothetical protein
MSWWWQLSTSIGAALLLAWIAVLIELLAAKPANGQLKDALRLLPDLLRLLQRLAADRTLPHGVRIRLGPLLACVAVPFDLIPDFIPILGLYRRRDHRHRRTSLGGPQRPPRCRLPTLTRYR